MHFHTRSFNGRLIAHLLGVMLVGMSIFMLFPTLISFCYNDNAQWGLSLSVIITFILGVFFRNILGKKTNYEFHEKESFWITSLIWLIIPAVCTLPFLLTGTLTNFTDAFFESVSGFTSTGSSVIQNLDNIPKGVLVWRSLSQWIGGLGLILLTIAFLRKLKSGTTHLYNAEFSGTIQRKLHPHISVSVSRMWYIYIFFSVLLCIILLCLGNDFFESICLTMSTVSTGGFSPRTGSISTFSDATQYTLMVFMFLAGINISLLYYLIIRKPKRLWTDEEFRWYVLIIFSFSIVLTILLITCGSHIGEATKYSFFQVVSAISTCGYYISIPSNCEKLVTITLFLLMFWGACSGSTGGGLKIVRPLILTKYVRNQFIKTLHPNAIIPVKINKNVITTNYINKIFAFIFMYIIFIVAGSFVLICCGINIPDSVALITANISNIGPVIDTIGSSHNYVELPIIAKWAIITVMIVGRLEVFAIIAIFSPSYWRG